MTKLYHITRSDCPTILWSCVALSSHQALQFYSQHSGIGYNVAVARFRAQFVRTMPEHMKAAQDDINLEYGTLRQGLVELQRLVEKYGSDARIQKITRFNNPYVGRDTHDVLVVSGVTVPTLQRLKELSGLK